jgi:hypothetical protein
MWGMNKEFQKWTVFLGFRKIQNWNNNNWWSELQPCKCKAIKIKIRKTKINHLNIQQKEKGIVVISLQQQQNYSWNSTFLKSYNILNHQSKGFMQRVEAPRDD